jgi:hypothetical protein
MSATSASSAPVDSSLSALWSSNAGVDEHLKARREHVGRDVDVDFYFGFGCHGERSENWNR